MRQKQDHTGVFIPSLSALLSSGIFAALLIHKAVQHADGDYSATRYTTARNQLLGELIEWLADAIGIAGSIGLSVLLVAVSAFFFVRAIRKYRALVAADEKV
jgi:hypothetical protein